MFKSTLGNLGYAQPCKLNHFSTKIFKIKLENIFPSSGYLSPARILLDWISIDAKISNKICLFLCSIILHPAEKLETFFIVCFIPDVTDVSFSFAKNKSRKNRSLTVTHTIQRRVFRLKGWYKSNYNKTQKYKYCHIFGCHDAAKIV